MPKRDLLKEVLSIFGTYGLCVLFVCLLIVWRIVVRSKTLAKLGQDWQDIMKKTLQSEDF